MQYSIKHFDNKWLNKRYKDFLVKRNDVDMPIVKKVRYFLGLIHPKTIAESVVYFILTAILCTGVIIFPWGVMTVLSGAMSLLIMFLSFYVLLEDHKKPNITGKGMTADEKFLLFLEKEVPVLINEQIILAKNELDSIKNRLAICKSNSSQLDENIHGFDSYTINELRDEINSEVNELQYVGCEYESFIDGAKELIGFFSMKCHEIKSEIDKQYLVRSIVSHKKDTVKSEIMLNELRSNMKTILDDIDHKVTKTIEYKRMSLTVN